MSVYVNQGYLLLILETGIDISAASVLKIKYKKPDGSSGNYPGTLHGTTQIQYQFANIDLNISGSWQFQAWVTIGGLDAYGDVASINVLSNL